MPQAPRLGGVGAGGLRSAAQQGQGGGQGQGQAAAVALLQAGGVHAIPAHQAPALRHLQGRLQQVGEDWQGCKDGGAGGGAHQCETAGRRG